MNNSVEDLIEAHKDIAKEVYFDIENSSPVPRKVIEAMLPYYNRKAYGNPTLTHKPGWEAYETILAASKIVASYIGAKNPEEISFTPGETEANNLAIHGTVLNKKGKGSKIVISEIEPLGVLHTCEMLEKFGYKTVKIPVDREGFIDLEQLKTAVDKNTVLVSMMSVNHEIGTIEPIKDAVGIVKDKNPEAVFHTDISDAYGKIPYSVKEIPVDLATMSSYKILGPRGIGALYVREDVQLEKILEGQIGTQKLWPGVENTPLIVGFTKASELAFTNFEANVSHMRKLRGKLIEGLTTGIEDTLINGPLSDKRAPDNANISFLKCEGEALTIELSLKGVYVSSGSACTRRLLQPSHVLVAIGRKYEEAHGSILMKVTRLHRDNDVEYALAAFQEAVERLRKVYGSMEEA